MSSLTSPTSVSTPSSTNRSITTTSTGSPLHSLAATPTSSSTTLNSQTHIGFIGGGQMASAMIQGLIRANTVRPSQISASDAQPAQLQALRQHGITTTQNNVEIAKTSNVIILSVKPHIVSVVLREISSYITPHHILLSIAAGVTLSTMEAQLPQGSRVVRVMPNTPALVGLTAACYSLGANATTQDAQLVEIIISAIGKGHPVDEKLLDAVTGLSGSGPAYVFIFIEALADGGVRAGLPRDVAMALAAQTVLGSAKMVLETGKHPAQLKDAVASPGGTTIAGIHALETGQFRGTVMNAVVAASQRATELAEAAKKQSNSKL